ncbi:MAG TPA: EAL domain-containing protein [Blastocatellia bacterium]|nr:EAL domain-containing protein [Blastocatellia bacterium]
MESKPPNEQQGYLKPYMIAVVLVGAVALLHTLSALPREALNQRYLLLVAVTLIVGSRITVHFFRFDSCISLSDIFIFLSLMMFDGEAAILLAGLEGFVSSLRITKKKLTMAFNAAGMLIATFITVRALRISFGSITGVMQEDFSSRLIMVTCVMAIVQYISNSGVVAVAGALLIRRPFWETYKKHYVWTSITHLAGASAAVITIKLIQAIGFYAFMATLPILFIVYFTYTTYLKSVESSAVQAEQAERHLKEMQASEERFRSAFDLAPIGMALVAPDGRWMQVNQSLSEIVGYSEDEFKCMNFQTITHASDLQAFMQNVTEVLEGRTLTCQMEKRYYHKQGHEVWVLVGVSLIRDSQNQQSHLIFQIQDITDRKRAEQQLVHDAFHDALTGLPNRAWFMEQLQMSLDRAKKKPERLFAMLFLDLDRFKLINDSIGHLVGDQLLIGIAQRLRQCVRPTDKVARLGGDEFTILLDGLRDEQEAIDIAERIQRQVSQPFALNGYETFTTASIGISFSNIGYERAEDFLRDADTAMYQAKFLGKARHVIFDKGMHAHAVNMLQLETDLRRAIDRHEFFIQYQPIVSLETGRLSGFEALIRWQHPERGLIPPDKFIAVAEETGCIVSIGRWVLYEACRQMQQWHEVYQLREPLFVSVNLSTKQFSQVNLYDEIVQTLSATRLDPRALKLEITESIVMENIETVNGTLEQIRALGVEVSMDDFGTGYSSLSYLHRLPIDTLKIDRSFVTRMIENNENKEIVRTIILLAQNLGKHVIAEGVETKEQVEVLRELRCHSGQGYLFSPPLGADKADKMIESMTNWQARVPGLSELFDENNFGPIISNYSM